jgi:hypothetical protein
MTDPDRDIRRYDEEVRAAPARAESAAAASRRRLVSRLADLQARLERVGRGAEADLVRDLLVLVESVDIGRPLGEARPTDLARQAAVAGKYRHLLHVLYVPSDRSLFANYQDFGYWNGTAYGGRADLRPGYWVYVYPRWFVWRDGPGKP